MKEEKLHSINRRIIYKVRHIHSQASAVHCYFRPVQCQWLCWQTPNSSWAWPKDILWMLCSRNWVQVHVCLQALNLQHLCAHCGTVWAFKANLKGAQLRKVPRFLARTEKCSPLSLIICWTSIWKKRNRVLFLSIFLREESLCYNNWLPLIFFLTSHSSYFALLFYLHPDAKAFILISFITCDRCHNTFYCLYCSNV